MPYTPIHPSVSSRINSEYAAYYEANLASQPEIYDLPLATVRSAGGILVPGGGPLLPVGKTEDLRVGPANDVPVRCFTPPGSPPDGGWPAMLYMHGGGWVLGNLDTENVIATHLCARAKCVIVAVDYRLAPENPFPAAVEDAWQAALWLANTAPSLLPINPDRLCIGGCSAGGNLAAVICQRAASIPPSSSPSSPAPSFRLQLLLAPVMDNTADTSNNPSWAENEHAPFLSAVKMLWFRNLYLPDEKDRSHPEASPLLWTGDWAALPPAVVVLAGLDPLRHEGERFASRLRDASVDVRLKVFEGQPHPFGAMDGVLEDGRRALTWICESVRDVMYASSSQ
ncbi:hypothetical protein CP533_5408 [Ophiocordyceps camponoti-saundersi (nom. inval.)]|nr:hypothetical protein CP533_5408 [Ophiocordyceps camponoti-saundersi (nom. inval.)]